MMSIYVDQRVLKTLPVRALTNAFLLFILAHGMFLQLPAQELMVWVEWVLLPSCTLGLVLLCGIYMMQSRQYDSPLPALHRWVLTGLRRLAWLSFLLAAIAAAVGGFCSISTSGWDTVYQWMGLIAFIAMFDLVFRIHAQIEQW